MEKHILSKSTFIKGHQCLKALYLHKKRPFLRDKMSAEQLAKFKRGHKVGDMAQLLFPGGIDVSPKSPSQYQKSAIQTQELIASGQTIIYEATFQFNKVLVMLDILVKTEKGWHAYEVKSSLGLSKTYYTDAALQYYVITQSGLNLTSFSLVYVNDAYILEKEGEIDVQSFFIKQEVSEQILRKQSEIAKEIEIELQILTEAHSPKIEVGAHCFAPYPCDFLGFCWKTKATDVLKLPALSKADRTALLNRNVLSLADLRNEKWNNLLVEKQLDSLVAKEPFVSDDLKTLISALPKDIAYLGFVARQPAIPQCVGYKPYQNQLFAYSILSNENKESKMYSGQCGDYQIFIEHLLKQLVLLPRIVVFDKEYFSAILAHAAEFFPDIQNEIEKISQRTLGIKQWVKDGQFYFPGLKHDLLFKDVVKQVLNTNAFAKLPIYADVMAVNFFGQMLENQSPSDSSSEEGQNLLSYSENIAENCKLMIEKIGKAEEEG